MRDVGLGFLQLLRPPRALRGSEFIQALGRSLRACGDESCRQFLHARLERGGDLPGELGARRGAKLVKFHRDAPVRFKRLEARLPVAAADEEALQAVVIALRDGVELVVVAARARDGEAEERLGHHVEAVVHAVALVLPDVHGRMHFLTEKPEAGAEQRFIRAARAQARLRHEVAGDMLGDELVVRHAVVQRADDVVAILPGVRNDRLPLMPARLRVAHEVQPVPRPALAEMRRRQQAIHDLRERLRRSVLEKRLDLRGLRRQANQIEVSAAQQRRLLRVRRGLELLSL